FFFSSRRRHTRFSRDWSSDVCSSDLPVNALLAQGVFALLLVALGTATRGGFQTMVDFTAPVFWTFFLLSTIALIVLRRREPQVRSEERRVGKERRSRWAPGRRADE